MEALKSICESVAVAGIILALLAGFLFKSKRIRITSLALALLAALGVWAMEKFAKYPITEASGSAILFFRGGDAEKDWKRSGFGNESTVEIFKNDSCLLKLASIRTSARGLEKGLSVFRNEYSLSVGGAYVNADFEDLDGVDSIVISDPGCLPPVDLIDGRLELRLNGNKYYGIGVERISCEGKRLKIETMALDRYRMSPAGKTDFGWFTSRDKEMAGTWIGTRTYPEGRLLVTSILIADMKEDHTYSATVRMHSQPLWLEHTEYAEAGFWKADKGGIKVIPGHCQANRYYERGLMLFSGLGRIPCDRKQALAFGLSGDSLNIVTLSDGKPVTFPMHRL